MCPFPIADKPREHRSSYRSLFSTESRSRRRCASESQSESESSRCVPKDTEHARHKRSNACTEIQTQRPTKRYSETHHHQSTAPKHAAIVRTEPQNQNSKDSRIGQTQVESHELGSHHKIKEAPLLTCPRYMRSNPNPNPVCKIWKPHYPEESVMIAHM